MTHIIKYMKKINFMSPIGYTGYGITSLNILKELDRRCEVSLFPIGNSASGLNDQEDVDLTNKCISNAKDFDHKASCVKIWHQHDLANRIGSGKYLSFPFFELDKLSKFEIHNINACDMVFTASEWSKNILINNGCTTQIQVCPLGVNRNIFKPTTDKIKTNKYIFFSIGKWEKRKSQDVILSCFENAFEKNDDVELWLCAHNPFLTENELRYWVNMVKYHKLYEKIKVFSRLPTQYDVASMISNCDCGLFVSRAEGWNNEVLESMSMDKPCIVTDYSAHTEYCNDKNSFLVKINETELANDGKWFFGQGSWAKIGQKQTDNIIEHMRYVYNNDIRTNNAGVETSIKYSWKNTAEIIYANT